MCGACLAAAIFSNVAQLINKGDAPSARYQAQVDKINEFIRFHKIGPELQACAFSHHRAELMVKMHWPSVTMAAR